MTSVLELVSLTTGVLPSTLAEAALRALVLGAAVGLGLHLLRVRNPYIKLVAWRAVLIGALAMPLLMPLMVLRVLPAVVPVAAPTMTLDVPDLAFDAVVAPVVADAAFDWHVLLLPVYLIVAGALLLRLAFGLALTWRLRAEAQPLNAIWTEDADVRVSGALHAPVNVGATILVPVDHVQWSDEQRRAVMLHERAHIARGDFHFQTLAGLHRAVFWFNPLAWWLYDTLADLAEVASDAEAARGLNERSSYAAILLDFAAKPRTHSLIAVGMARRETVRRRIERILTEAVLPARVRRGTQVVIAAALVPFVLGAAVSLAQAPVTQIPLPPAAPPRLLVPNPPPVAAAPDSGVEIDIEDIQERAERLAERGAERAQRALKRTAGKELEIAERAQRRAERALERAAERAAERERGQIRLPNTAEIEQHVAKAMARVPNVPDVIAKSFVGAARITPPNAVKEERAVSDFTAVALATGFGSISVTIGDKASLVLEGDADTLRDIKAEVRHGTLVIDRKTSRDGGQRRFPITAHVTVTLLKAISLSGSGVIRVAGFNGGETDISLSGAGVIEATGRLDKLDLNISGSGKANMPELLVDNAEVNISGSGDATINSTGELDVDISGSARVHYVGRPARLRTSISGWGTVHQL